MPSIPFASDKQKKQLLALAADQKYWKRMAEELSALLREPHAMATQGLVAAFQLLGVPTDGRVVVIHDGEDGAAPGVCWEDEETIYERATGKWRPRTSEEKEALKAKNGDW